MLRALIRCVFSCVLAVWVAFTLQGCGSKEAETKKMEKPKVCRPCAPSGEICCSGGTYLSSLEEKNGCSLSLAYWSQARTCCNDESKTTDGEIGKCLDDAVAAHNASGASKTSPLQDLLQNLNKSRNGELPNYSEAACRSALEKRYTVVSNPQTSFESVIGLRGTKTQLNRNILLNVYRYGVAGKSPENKKMGSIFFGPPGTGKTYIAKALATEMQRILQNASNHSSVTFIGISPAQIMSKWSGESEKHIEELFKCARILSPSVLFFDEGDALFSGEREDEKQHHASLRAQLLSSLDGVSSGNDDFIVPIIATNRIDSLDVAFYRRLPYKIYFPLPLRSEREDLLQFYAKAEGVRWPDGFFDGSPSCLTKVAEQLRNWSASDLANLISALARVMKTKVAQSFGKDMNIDFTSDDFANQLVRLSPNESERFLNVLDNGGSHTANMTLADWSAANFMVARTPVPLHVYEKQAETHAKSALAQYKEAEHKEDEQARAKFPSAWAEVGNCFPSASSLLERKYLPRMSGRARKWQAHKALIAQDRLHSHKVYDNSFS